MKILHCSDIHLGKRPIGKKEYSNIRYNDYFKAFENIVNYAIENYIDIFLITGDFFDRKELFPEILLRAEEILLKLKKKNIPVLLIEGNHDKISQNKKDESWLIYLHNKKIIEILDTDHIDGDFKFHPKKIENINFYGLGYFGIFTDEVIESLSKKIDENEKNIVLVHTALGSNDNNSFFPGTISSNSIKKLKDKVLYVAGGHFHSFSKYPKKNPFFFVPGSPEYWDLAEKGKRGFIIFDTQTKEYQFIESKKREKIDIILNIKAKTISEFNEEFESKIDALKILKESLVYLIINLENSITIDVNHCEDYIENLGVIKVLISVKYNLNKIDINGNERKFNIEDIEREVISSMGEFSDFTNPIVSTLTKLKNNHLEKNESLFFDNYLSMINSIIENPVIETSDKLESENE